MKTRIRNGRTSFTERYPVFEFTKLGMTIGASIILIGSFMRFIFG